MKYPPVIPSSTAPTRWSAHLPDNATWRTPIYSAIDRMDVEAEAESLYAATINALESGDTSDCAPEK